MSDYDIITTNQANNMLEVYNDNATDWNSSSALLWSWKPTTSNGYTSTQVSAWNQPNGAKLRDNDTNWGGRWIVATSSGGLATIASYPGGSNKWAVNVGGNPHDAELLPNGNIAIAASTGGWIRVYASSQGATNGTYGNFAMPNAHSVLWDPSLSRLWALGGDYIRAFTIGGTAASPTLTEDTTRAYLVPASSGVRDGHFLYPYYGDASKMWVATGSRVYVFNKADGSFANAPTGVFKWGVKAVGNQPSGVNFFCRPDNLESPAWPEPSTLYDWTTKYIQFYTSAGASYTRHRSSADWYKGILFWPEYQYSSATAADYPIITVNQATSKVEIYNFYSTNWNSATDLSWSWQPSTTNGFVAAEITAWSLPSDAKLRNNSIWGGQWLVATSSGGLVAIAAYPGGAKKWAYNVTGNPVGAELLPNGNIAISNSTSNWVRIYASSQGAGNSTFCQADFIAARSVLWDPANSVLWAGGSGFITAYTVGGTDAAPTITEVSTRKVALPAGNTIIYFLSPYYGDTNKLWVSTDTHVYIYNKSAKTFTLATAGIDKSAVRAVSHQPSGVVVLNRPDAVKSPQPADPSTLNTWTTSYIDYYTAAGMWRTAGHKIGGAYFKGVVCRPEYQ
ncbi:MAG: hypothetical protein HZA31_07415 [Opitutae bacterium]|nr:hypothetical protein [Opitutae bacterium]